jgi:hypothetical protein
MKLVPKSPLVYAVNQVVASGVKPVGRAVASPAEKVAVAPQKVVRTSYSMTKFLATGADRVSYSLNCKLLFYCFLYTFIT